MSSHQDYLARRRLTATLMNPSANMPSVLQAHSYTEVKAFVLETACAAASVSTQLRQSLITAETAAHTSSTGLAAADPGKYDLRGLPTLLVENCPPEYPMLVGTSDMLEDGTTPARGNRVPANNTCLSSSSCAVDTLTRRRWPNDGYSAYWRVPERARHRACNDAACRATLQEEEEVVLLVPPVVVSAVLWLDASDRNSMTQNVEGNEPVTAPNQIVRRWNDKSKSELSFVAVDGNAQQTWVDGMVKCGGHSEAGMVLNAANADTLPLSTEGRSPDSTVFMVLRREMQRTESVFAYGVYDGSPRWWGFFTGEGEGFVTGAFNQYTTVYAPATYNLSLVTTVHQSPDNPGITLWMDGQESPWGSPSDPIDWSSSNTEGNGSAWLFHYTGSNSWNALPFDGSLAELLVLDHVLSDADRQAVEGHLAWKWGTQSALPAGHPYRTVQPPELDIQ